MNDSSKYIEFLGKKVEVVIDRPLGSFHPNFNFRYEVNYGFIPNTLAGDGLEIDAYILGEKKPLSTFQGTVKAIIFRKDDIEHKLVVTKPEYVLTVDSVRQQTSFQEQFFQTEIKLLSA